MKIKWMRIRWTKMKHLRKPLVSRTSRNQLVSAAAGAAVTLAALWLALIRAAAATIILCA